MTTSTLASLTLAAARDLVAVLLDDACAGCGAPLEGALGPACACCRERLAAAQPRCRRCSEPLAAPWGADSDPCASEPSSCGRRECGRRALRVEAPRRHGGPARRLVHALKYRGRRDIAELLASTTLADERVRAALAGAHVVVPVPVDPLRGHERGYNQAELIASALVDLARRTGVTRAVLKCVLARRATPAPQARLSRSARRAAVRSSMRGRWLATRAVSGKDVVLVDDVVTTGATTREAGRVLRRLGARSVVVVACTKTPAWTVR